MSPSGRRRAHRLRALSPLQDSELALDAVEVQMEPQMPAGRQKWGLRQGEQLGSTVTGIGCWASSRFLRNTKKRDRSTAQRRALHIFFLRLL